MSIREFVMVIVQFSFSNARVVPVGIRYRQQEGPVQSFVRHQHNNGQQVIAPTEKCSVINLSHLEKIGFLLSDAWAQERWNQNNPGARFSAVRFEYRNPHSDFEQKMLKEESATSARIGFLNLAMSAAWRVRVFNNPFFVSGQEVPGKRVLSINLEGRFPLFNSDGKPVCQRLRDEQGKPYGDPIPVQPDYELKLEPLTLVSWGSDVDNPEVTTPIVSDGANVTTPIVFEVTTPIDPEVTTPVL